jgi:transcriptional antiterminator RfaH
MCLIGIGYNGGLISQWSVASVLEQSVLQWYLAYTKPRQERIALDNLQRQGYECFLPLLKKEVKKQGVMKIVEEPLFPRYLFVRVSKTMGAGFGPLRSTVGMNSLISFNGAPAVIDDSLIEAIKARQASVEVSVQDLFKHGDKVRIVDGAFAGYEAIFEAKDGEGRVLLLLDFLSKKRVLSFKLDVIAKD